MFFTRQYDYALRVIRILADGELLSVNEICTAEHVPQPYAYKILKKLEKGSFVVSSRGVNGGYRLTRELKDISLYDVYQAVEGEILINECMQEGYACSRNCGGDSCTIHTELYKLQKEFIDKMQSLNMSAALKLENY